MPQKDGKENKSKLFLVKSRNEKPLTVSFILLSAVLYFFKSFCYCNRSRPKTRVKSATVSTIPITIK